MAGNISSWTRDEVQSNLKGLHLSPGTLEKFVDFDGAIISVLSQPDCLAMGVPVKDYLKILAMVRRRISDEKKASKLESILKKFLYLINDFLFPSMFSIQTQSI